MNPSAHRHESVLSLLDATQTEHKTEERNNTDFPRLLQCTPERAVAQYPVTQFLQTLAVTNNVPDSSTPC